MSQWGWELLKRGLHVRGIWQGYLVRKCLLPLSLGISSWSGQMGIAVFQLSFIYSIRLLARKSLLTSGLNYSKRRKVRWELHMIVNYANNLLTNLIISILDKYSLLFLYNVHLAFHFFLSCSIFFSHTLPNKYYAECYTVYLNCYVYSCLLHPVKCKLHSGKEFCLLCSLKY